MNICYRNIWLVCIFGLNFALFVVQNQTCAIFFFYLGYCYKYSHCKEKSTTNLSLHITSS